MTWKPTEDVVIMAISIVSQLSDTEATELNGLVLPVHKVREVMDMGQAFPVSDFRVYFLHFLTPVSFTFVFYPLFLLTVAMGKHS